MAIRLAIHVSHNVDPIKITETLALLSQQPSLSFRTVPDFVLQMREAGVEANEWVRTFSLAMGLLVPNGSHLEVSPIGSALLRARDELRRELYHFLMFSTWSEQDPLYFLPSWAYRQCCISYMQQENRTMDSEYRTRQVAAINQLAIDSFSKHGEVKDPSFSVLSLRGIKKWLEALHPPVLTDNRFTRRTFCVPELMVLALAFSVRDEPDAVNVDILLTTERRDVIAQLCLLAPESVDHVLDYALASFAHLIQSGTGAGIYGRFVRLLKRPTIEDLIP